ncbi:hypothetical protein VARIO8X_60222 [Burkholderiales bacterium 8X]|nr:hypothetical protein VARIO8X_60222 [Burkholderiales bacterium 8X]
MPTSTITCRCWSAPGAIRPTAARELRRRRSLQLAFAQRVQLEMTALVPQPGIGIGHLAEPRRGREGRGLQHRPLDLLDDLGRMPRGAHPVHRQHPAVGIEIHLQRADRVEQRRQLAAVDPLLVDFVEMTRGILPVVARVAGIGGPRCAAGHFRRIGRDVRELSRNRLGDRCIGPGAAAARDAGRGDERCDQRRRRHGFRCAAKALWQALRDQGGKLHRRVYTAVAAAPRNRRYPE